MTENVKHILKKLTRTMFAVYLAAFILVAVFFNHKDIMWHAHAATLSRLQPPYGYLTKFSDGKLAFDRKQLQIYRLFFSQLLGALSPRPDGYAMLAFCEYHLGDTKNAMAHYTMAADTAPYFLWFNYNLGYLYFEQRDYGQAAKYLLQAVRSDPDAIAKFIMASKLYMDAITSAPEISAGMEERLDSGFRDSYKMLVLSCYNLKRFNELILMADLAVNQKLDDDGFFYYYLGVGAFYSQQFERAALYLREALARNPQSPEAYYYLALTLKALNKENLAAQALQKAEILAQAKGPSYDTIKNLKVRIF